MKAPALIVSISIVLISAEVLAGPVEEAKEHFFKGKELVENGQYEEAIVELKESYYLNPIPLVVYNIAYCYDTLGQYEEALKQYRLFLSKSNKSTAHLDDEVTQRIEELAQLFGTLKLEVDEEGAAVIIDGEQVGTTPVSEMVLRTGQHDLLLKKEGLPDMEATFNVEPGLTAELSFSMNVEEQEEGQEVEIPEKKTIKVLGPEPFGIAVGVTAAALVATTLTGSFAIAKDKKISTMWEDENWKAVRDERDRLADATNAMLGITVIGAALSVALFFITDFKRAGKEKKVDALILPDLRTGFLSAGIGGEF
jgi:hypothetical protein